MQQSLTVSKLEYVLYRLSTVLSSLKTLYTLSPEKTQDFLNSHDIYDYEWNNEAELIDKMGTNYYPKISKKIVDDYSVLNHLCAIGHVEKMYIPPIMDISKSIIQNQNLFEKKMSQDLGINANDKVLDIGCGRGRVAIHMAKLTGAKLTGINIDQNQISAANKYVKGYGLAKQCKFKKWDMNTLPLPFPDNHFNAFYEVQAMSYSKDLVKLLKEIHRILKPGAKIGLLEWVILPAFDSNNTHHVDLVKKVKPLIKAIGNPTIDVYVAALKKAGFKIIINENVSADGLQAPLIEKADKFFNRATKLVGFLVKTKILPAHIKTIFDRFIRDGEAFTEADRLRIVTTSHYFVAQK